MNKRTKTNIVLLALITLVAVILFVTGGNKPAVTETAVSAIEGNRITRISVTRAGRAQLRFIKQGNTWQMVSPQTAPANPTRIHAILSVLQARSYTQLDAGKMELGRFDLVDPVVTLKLDDLEFRFGGSNPLEGRRYLLFRHTIHLIDDGLYQQLLQPAQFFIRVRKE